MFTKHINSAATTNAQRVFAQGTSLYTVHCFNAGGAAAFVKLYDTPITQATPVVGTDVPVLVIGIAAGGTYSLESFKGIQFTKTLALAITNLAADSDTTAVAANQVKVSIAYGG